MLYLNNFTLKFLDFSLLNFAQLGHINKLNLSKKSFQNFSEVVNSLEPKVVVKVFLMQHNFEKLN